MSGKWGAYGAILYYLDCFAPPTNSERMIRRTPVLVVMMLLALATDARAQSQADSAPPRVLQAGDAVQITVWQNAELSGEFAIAEDGSIAHPLLREVRVAGLPLSGVEARVRERLQRFDTDPQFVIQPLLRVAVGGEVRQPSLYRLPPTTTIAEAVALAGGGSDRARLDRVRLFRGGEEIMVDLTNPEAGLAQTPISSGDQIFVDRRVSIFRDYIAPAGSITAALVSLVNVLTR
jgi:protein involved in polysaccharide export with SLBB domain